MIAALLRALRAVGARIRRSSRTPTPPVPALCAPAGSCLCAALPTRDEARGAVLAALVTDPRGPWMVVVIDPVRGPWMPLVRPTLGGLRRLPFATRWGDA